MLLEAIEHSYKGHVTNKEVRRKTEAAIGEYDEVLTLVKKRRLRWFGHVSGLWFSNDNPVWHIERKKKKMQTEEEVGRQYHRVDRHGLASSTRAAENRTRWKGIVANSSVVPRRPSKIMG